MAAGVRGRLLLLAPAGLPYQCCSHLVPLVLMTQFGTAHVQRGSRRIAVATRAWLGRGSNDDDELGRRPAHVCGALWPGRVVCAAAHRRGRRLVAAAGRPVRHVLWVSRQSGADAALGRSARATDRHGRRLLRVDPPLRGDPAVPRTRAPPWQDGAPERAPPAATRTL